MRNGYGIWFGLILMALGCGSETSDSPQVVEQAEDVTNLDLQGLADADQEDAPDVEEVATPDVEEDDTGVEDITDTADVVEEPQYACPEQINAPLPAGAGFIYNCISNAEGLPYQVIRQIRGGAEEIETRVEVVAPERLGSTLKVRGEWAYYHTVTIEDELAVTRSLYRFKLEGGEAELVRQFTEESVAEPMFSQSGVELEPLLQPDGDRISFHLMSPTSQVNKATLYSFVEGDTESLDVLDLGADGGVRRAQWNLDGSQVLYTVGGTLTTVGEDLSGPKTLDNQVNSTPAAPHEIKPGVYTYVTKEGLKFVVRVLTDLSDGDEGGSTSKDDYAFDEAIEDIYPLNENEVIVFADQLYHLNIASGATEGLGEIPGFGEHPLTISPQGDGFIIGGSIDNPYRSFEYHHMSITGESAGLILGTEKGVGYVTSGAVWY